MTSETPIVKIRPGKGRRFAEGAPWLFADEIAMDRRTKALEPGTLVRLIQADRDCGIAAFNPQSRIAARVLDTDPIAKIDQHWLSERLRKAQALRQRLFEAPFYRLVHAEGDSLPGVIVDRFGDAVVLQPNAAWADRMQEALIGAISEVTGAKTIVVNATSRVRKLEGLDTGLHVHGPAPEGPIEVPMNGAVYLADLTGGQKTGLYFDQRPNHAFAMAFAKNAKVLDVFSHVGGFGLAMLAGGAENVMAIDSSAAALDLAKTASDRMGQAAKYRTQKSDAFNALENLAGESFDIVICDPPAFAPNKDAMAAGLRAYEKVARLAAPLVAPGGVLGLCSCSHAVGTTSFHKACVDGIRKAGRAGALIHAGRAGPDHPVHIGLPEGGYLKAHFFRLDG
ncbi:MAG: class I SAM-dependent rRNA methyltransferase [Pseudomonadota bacterium]